MKMGKKKLDYKGLFKNLTRTGSRVPFIFLGGTGSILIFLKGIGTEGSS